MTKPLDDEALWKEFGIKSAPKFPNQCWSDIPDEWADDIRELISDIQRVVPDVRFIQIKEKFGQLRVYYETNHEENRDRINARINRTTRKLAGK